MFEELLAQKEKLIDEKRELEFVLIMLDEQKGRLKGRELKRLEDMEHKIEVQILGQEKI